MVLHFGHSVPSFIGITMSSTKVPCTQTLDARYCAVAFAADDAELALRLIATAGVGQDEVAATRRSLQLREAQKAKGRFSKAAR